MVKRWACSGGAEGTVMRCRGMCTHGEVLLQRVSALLLQVEGGGVVGWGGEGGGEGSGRDSDGNKECTHRQ